MNNTTNVIIDISKFIATELGDKRKDPIVTWTLTCSICVGHHYAQTNYLKTYICIIISHLINFFLYLPKNNISKSATARLNR
jgi:hypothetical protein